MIAVTHRTPQLLAAGSCLCLLKLVVVAMLACAVIPDISNAQAVPRRVNTLLTVRPLTPPATTAVEQLRYDIVRATSRYGRIRPRLLLQQPALRKWKRWSPTGPPRDLSVTQSPLRSYVQKEPVQVLRDLSQTQPPLRRYRRKKSGDRQQK